MTGTDRHATGDRLVAGNISLSLDGRTTGPGGEYPIRRPLSSGCFAKNLACHQGTTIAYNLQNAVLSCTSSRMRTSPHGSGTSTAAGPRATAA